ncbi:MAG: hypothetical protein U0Y10_21445 [Spirosomataceae bacterium]
MKKIYLLLLLYGFYWTSSVAQVTTPNNIQEALSDEDAFLDSLSWLYPEKTGTLSFRLGYTNHAYFAGRDYDIKQYMLMPSITYQHKSGVYADLSGLSYSQSNPMYEMTMASVGYMGIVGSNFWFFGEYSRTFLTKPDPDNPNPIPNALTVFAMYDLGKVMPSVAYAYMFGDETTQRIIPSVSGYFAKKLNGFIDRITFSPGISVTLGTTNSYYFNYVPTPNPGRFPPVTLTPTLYATEHFGVMAYTLSAPVSFRMKSLRLTFTPNLIKPVKLYSAEDITTNRKVNFSVSLYYSLGI